MDHICGGDLPIPEPHNGDLNTFRLCLREENGRVADYMMNKSDLDWLRWIMDALDGKKTSWLSNRESGRR